MGLILMVMFLGGMFSGCRQERKGGPLTAGDTAPDFAARDLEGDVIVLSSLAGKPVVVRFWETNCKFCKADTPIFNRYFEKYRDKGLRVIYISSFYENTAAVRQFIDLLEVPFPVVMDEGAKLADLYNVKLYPQTFLIGPDRKIIANIFGSVGEAEFNELLGGYLR
jgi:peroxiredoxin